jgi:hypothetical protein
VDAVFTAPQFREAHRAHRCAQQLAILVAMALSTSIALAAVYGLVRRYAGGIATPLPAGALVLSGVLLAAVMFTMRLAVGRFQGALTSRRLGIAAMTLPAMATLLAASALSLPGSSIWGLVGLWGMTLGAVAVASARWRTGFRRPRTNGEPYAPGGSLEDDSDRAVHQRWTRRREPGGIDVIEGWIRADFPTGARVTHVHTTFCPPFASTPHIEAEPVEGPTSTLKIGPVYPHGARVEIRLEHAAPEPVRIMVALLARGMAAQ